jgi:Tfp pilus assembly pilus retraction ATPase PilT
MEITDLLIYTQKNNASDLHLSTGNPPILRVHGEIMPYKIDPLTVDNVKHMLYSARLRAGFRHFLRRKPALPRQCIQYVQRPGGGASRHSQLHSVA